MFPCLHVYVHRYETPRAISTNNRGTTSKSHLAFAHFLKSSVGWCQTLQNNCQTLHQNPRALHLIFNRDPKPNTTFQPNS